MRDICVCKCVLILEDAAVRPRLEGRNASMSRAGSGHRRPGRRVARREAVLRRILDQRGLRRVRRARRPVALAGGSSGTRLSARASPSAALPSATRQAIVSGKVSAGHNSAAPPIAAPMRGSIKGVNSVPSSGISPTRNSGFPAPTEGPCREFRDRSGTQSANSSNLRHSLRHNAPGIWRVFRSGGVREMQAIKAAGCDPADGDG
jgi:hypothetical protein